ncbi:MAG: hypothetical protein IT371_07515 [Deltaproteobacteria bacterium]|nr:hypothetical protein [Deltaproteobacteria bacterium]
MSEPGKIMYEIYRDSGFSGGYRVVYYTELSERNKELEIGRAMSGEHLFDGFIAEARKGEAKAIIEGFVARLNQGERARPEELEAALAELSA